MEGEGVDLGNPAAGAHAEVDPFTPINLTSFPLPIFFLNHSGGSEGNGLCTVTCAEWVKRPGTVGKPFPPVQLHIWDEEKQEEIKEPGREGAVFFSGGGEFEYNNDSVSGELDRRGKEGEAEVSGPLGSAGQDERVAEQAWLDDPWRCWLP